MQFTRLACAAALSAVVYANPAPLPANSNSASGASGASGTTGSSDSSSTTLSADAIQSGSFNNGVAEIGAEAGEANSLTSQNNFINNCVGKTLTNGLQITSGSCNGITMGDIPAKTNMVSSVITFPTTGGQPITAGQTFNISVQMSGLVAGSFTNADSTYYAAPQTLSGGNVVGHTHVTVQDLGDSLNPTQALDPTAFSFFKGINDAGNGKGLLQAVVTGGLPAGNYRVCTLASASNHQPVLMPVAQRGTADDCTKFVVSGNGGTENTAASDGSAGVAAAAEAASAVAAGPDNTAPPTASAAAATVASSVAAASVASASTAAANGQGSKSGGSKNGGSSAASAATAASATAAANGDGSKSGGSSAASAATAASATAAANGDGSKSGGSSGASAASASNKGSQNGGTSTEAPATAATVVANGEGSSAATASSASAASASSEASQNGGTFTEAPATASPVASAQGSEGGKGESGGSQGGNGGRFGRKRRSFIA